MAKNNFKKIDIYDRNYVNDAIYYKNPIKPYMTALVQQLPQNDPDYLPKYRILKVLNTNSEYKEFGGMPEFGNIVSSGMEQSKEYKLTEDEYNDCKNLLREYNDLRASASWEISGTFYAELKEGQEYFEIEPLDKQDWSLNPYTEEIHNLEDVENWMLTNHPDYYMGCSISHNVPSGDFVGHSVPSPEYSNGQWETWEGRREYVKGLCKERGIKVGPIEHDRDGGIIKLQSGDVVRYADLNGDDTEEKTEVDFVVTSVVGKFPKLIYTMKVISSDGKYASNDFPEGKECHFSAKDVGHYFSDIDCDNKHMYLVKGRQHEYEHESNLKYEKAETALKLSKEKTLPTRKAYPSREIEIPNVEPEPGYDYPEITY